MLPYRVRSQCCCFFQRQMMFFIIAYHAYGVHCVHEYNQLCTILYTWHSRCTEQKYTSNGTDWFSINTIWSVYRTIVISFILPFYQFDVVEKMSYTPLWCVSQKRNGEWKWTEQINTQKERCPESEYQMWPLHQQTWHYLHGSYLWLNRIICNPHKKTAKVYFNMGFIYEQNVAFTKNG